MRAMLKGASDATAAEYAMILAIIGSVVAFAALALGHSIGNSMNRSSECIDSSSAC